MRTETLDDERLGTKWRPAAHTVIIYNTIYPPWLFSLSPSHAHRRRRRRESVIRNHKNPIHNAAAVSVFITLYTFSFSVYAYTVYIFYNIYVHVFAGKYKRGQFTRVCCLSIYLYLYIMMYVYKWAQ